MIEEIQIMFQVKAHQCSARSLILRMSALSEGGHSPKFLATFMNTFAKTFELNNEEKRQFSGVGDINQTLYDKILNSTKNRLIYLHYSGNNFKAKLSRPENKVPVIGITFWDTDSFFFRLPQNFTRKSNSDILNYFRPLKNFPEERDWAFSDAILDTISEDSCIIEEVDSSASIPDLEDAPTGWESPLQIPSLESPPEDTTPQINLTPNPPDLPNVSEIDPLSDTQGCSQLSNDSSNENLDPSFIETEKFQIINNFFCLKHKEIKRHK